MNKRKNVEEEKIIDIKKIWAIIQKNFIVITRDKTRLVPLFLFPIFMILIFGYTSGTPSKHISTAIVVYDNGLVSQNIQTKISQSQIFSVRRIVSSEDEGKILLDKGEVSVVIIIPAKLQLNTNDGKISKITVMVDESDSSVAAIAKQTLSKIISATSSELGLKKIIYFQTSVARATAIIENANVCMLNEYPIITQNSIIAAQKLKATEDILSISISNTKASLSYPSALVLPTVYRTGGNFSIDTVFLTEPATYAIGKSQIAFMSSIKESVASARADIENSQLTSKRADAKVSNFLEYQNYYNNNVIPKEQINEFKNYDANAIMSPLAYEEKPAYGQGKQAIDFAIPSIIALIIFQGAVMGMGRAVAGEKKEGSLTRVFLTPTSNTTIILGTLIFYVMFETLRASFIIMIAMNLFHIKIAGSLIAIFLILIIYAFVSTAVGLLLSSMVQSEQQYMALSMLVSLPTMFLSGAFFPIQAMPKILQGIASFLPVTYAGEALRGVMTKGLPLSMVWYPVFILFVFLVLILGATFKVFKRELD